MLVVSTSSLVRQILYCDGAEGYIYSSQSDLWNQKLSADIVMKLAIGRNMVLQSMMQN